jgi:hypothetical protein
MLAAVMDGLAAVAGTVWAIAAYRHRTLEAPELLADRAAASVEMRRVPAASVVHRVWAVVEVEVVVVGVVAVAAVDADSY